MIVFVFTMCLGILAICLGASFVGNYEVIKAKYSPTVTMGELTAKLYGYKGSNLWPRDTGFVSMAVGGMVIIGSLHYLGTCRDKGGVS